MLPESPLAAPPTRPLTVLIVGTSFDFPHGGAASSRVFWYAKGLAETGADVRVVSLLGPSRSGPSGTSAVAGSYRGLRYEYACGTRERPDRFWRRRWLWVRRGVRTALLVHGAARRPPGTCVVLIYSEVTSWIAGLAILARAVGATSVVDLCEYPLVWRPASLATTLNRTLRMRLIGRFADGVIPISTYLEDYVRRSCGRVPPVLRVPVMVDPAMFSPRTGETATQAAREVLYCGGLDHVAEIERAIRAFAAAASDLDDVRLAVVGGGPAHLKQRAEAAAAAAGVGGRVEFVDRLSRDDLAERMAAAAVLILPRPAGLFSQAGLPNKLGEYLASGRPVVTTAVGDVPLYLDDGSSAFVVEPGDEARFGERIRYALMHPDEATLVGERGREVAAARFDYRAQTARLREFLEGSVVGARSARPGGVVACRSGVEAR